jgi:hypothetical protein
MARLAKQQPRRLWRESKYDLHTIAGGLPVECRRGEDYSCAHESFLVGLRRFAAEQDVIFRAEPVVGGDDQVGWTVQFFWNLYRSESRRTPPDFRHPSDTDDVLSECSPYVRRKYAEIPVQLRVPLSL